MNNNAHCTKASVESISSAHGISEWIEILLTLQENQET